MAKITNQELAKFAVDEIESGISEKAVAQKIAAFLLEERRTRDAAQVMRAIEDELARQGTNHVVITSAHDVTEQVKYELASLLDAKNPVFSDVIDKSVIGGVKAESGEKLIDLTVRARLQKFKAEIARSE